MEILFVYEFTCVWGEEINNEKICVKCIATFTFLISQLCVIKSLIFIVTGTLGKYFLSGLIFYWFCVWLLGIWWKGIFFNCGVFIASEIKFYSKNQIEVTQLFVNKFQDNYYKAYFIKLHKKSPELHQMLIFFFSCGFSLQKHCKKLYFRKFHDENNLEAYKGSVIIWKFINGAVFLLFWQASSLANIFLWTKINMKEKQKIFCCFILYSHLFIQIKRRMSWLNLK